MGLAPPRAADELGEWAQRPLDVVYPVLFIDAIHVKVRDGQVTNRPFYVVIGVTVDGHRDILGIWAGDGGEGAKYWLHVLTEIKNRGVVDACIVVCDGLKGLTESITTVWPQALVQACVLHLIRNTFRYASRRYWEQMAKDLRPVYTAPTEAAAAARFDEFTATWGGQYPAIIALWLNAWSEFVLFLDYDVEIRKVICSTNAIESINARFRRAVLEAGRVAGRAPSPQRRCVPPVDPLPVPLTASRTGAAPLVLRTDPISATPAGGATGCSWPATTSSDDAHPVEVETGGVTGERCGCIMIVSTTSASPGLLPQVPMRHRPDASQPKQPASGCGGPADADRIPPAGFDDRPGTNPRELLRRGEPSWSGSLMR